MTQDRDANFKMLRDRGGFKPGDIIILPDRRTSARVVSYTGPTVECRCAVCPNHGESCMMDSIYIPRMCKKNKVVLEIMEVPVTVEIPISEKETS